MVDRYQNLIQSAPGAFLSRRLGLPQPPVLRRYEADAPLTDGPVRLGSAPGGRLGAVIGAVLQDAHVPVESTGEPSSERRYGGLVFDATGITSADDLQTLYDFFHPVMRSVRRCGRVIVRSEEHTS